MLIIEKSEYKVSDIPSEVITVLTSTEMIAAYLVTAILMALTYIKRGPSSLPKEKTVKGVLTTLGIFSFNLMLSPVIALGVFYFRKLYEMANIPTLSSEIWVGTPYIIAAFVAIVSKDFVDYWNHRAMHTKWIWPIHAIHHSDEVVNGMTTFRIHALEALFMKITHVLVLSWMGMPPEVAASTHVLIMLLNMYVHADVDWNHGPFRLFLASPGFHRWHHADCPEAYGKNLANVLPLYDYMFGTYYEPVPCRERMGAKGVPHADLVGLLAFPFVEWARMISETKIAERFRKLTANHPGFTSAGEKPLTPARRNPSSNS